MNTSTWARSARTYVPRSISGIECSSGTVNIPRAMQMAVSLTRSRESSKDLSSSHHWSSFTLNGFWLSPENIVPPRKNIQAQSNRKIGNIDCGQKAQERSLQFTSVSWQSPRDQDHCNPYRQSFHRSRSQNFPFSQWLRYPTPTAPELATSAFMASRSEGPKGLTSACFPFNLVKRSTSSWPVGWKVTAEYSLFRTVLGSETAMRVIASAMWANALERSVSDTEDQSSLDSWSTHLMGTVFFNCFSLANTVLPLTSAPRKLGSVTQSPLEIKESTKGVFSPVPEEVTLKNSDVEDRDTDFLFNSAIPGTVTELDERSKIGIFFVLCIPGSGIGGWHVTDQVRGFGECIYEIGLMGKGSEPNRRARQLSDLATKKLW